ERRGVAARELHVRAGCGEGAGGCPADAAGGARHERGRSFHVHGEEVAIRDGHPPPSPTVIPERAPVGAIVVDFDGTIVQEDISEEILERFAPRAWWDVDLEFQRGAI